MAPQKDETTMVKQDIINETADNLGKSYFEVSEVLEEALLVVTNALRKHDSVILRGFGTFKVKKRASRYVRNIKTGEAHYTQPKDVVTFNVGKNLQSI